VLVVHDITQNPPLTVFERQQIGIEEAPRT
jgi:hypothetical protein